MFQYPLQGMLVVCYYFSHLWQTRATHGDTACCSLSTVRAEEEQPQLQALTSYCLTFDPRPSKIRWRTHCSTPYLLGITYPG